LISKTKIALSGAIAAGGAAGVLSALSVAFLLRSAPAANGVQATRPPRIDSDASSSEAEHPVAKSFKERLEEHEREAIDPSWASDARRAYEREFDDLATDAGFTLRGVDCRTTTCVADVTFPSYMAAKSCMQKIVLSHWTLNCAKEMKVDPVASDSPSYLTSIYFNCASARESSQAAKD
jgi:hypothetical protein